MSCTATDRSDIFADWVGVARRFRGWPMAAAQSLVLASLAIISATVIPASAASATSERPVLHVVATTGMIGDAARAVGGDDVTVSVLMGPGVDPHAYRATRSDIVAMSRADVVLAHGLTLEAQLRDFLDKLAQRTTVAFVAEGVAPETLIAHDTYADAYDPHLWMDPVRWTQTVDAVRDALTAARSDRTDAFTKNAARYSEELRALATYADARLATVPEAARVLVTAHDAFNYFGDAYGFDVVGIQGISTESEAGLQRTSSLVDLLVERGVGAVFVETSVSDRQVRALIEGAASRGHDVQIGGELYSDAMGSLGTYEGTYLGMIDHNVTTIARALGGDAPERGRLGKLQSGS